MIEDNVSIFSTYAQNKKIKLYSELSHSGLVLADRHMICTVIRNLIGNAIKFTNESGSIAVTSVETVDAITISVRDTGIGIPADRIADLFRIDVQYSTQGTSYEKGTGLGLIICKEFVERHSGRIFVESVEGQGSTFTVILPKMNKPS